MSESDGKPGNDKPTHSTIAINITTKGVPGVKMWSWSTRDGKQFFVGRAASVVQLVFPNPFVSSVHGQFYFRAGDWYYQHMGTNPSYIEHKGNVRSLAMEEDTLLDVGDVVYLLVPEPVNCLEVFPNMNVEEDDSDDVTPTKSGSTDLEYIDTKVELIVYILAVFERAPWYKLVILLLAILGGLALWLAMS